MTDEPASQPASSPQDITRQEAADRILAFADEGRLIQHDFQSKGADGRRLACILGAISETIESSACCPASVMPQWMAWLLPPLFDNTPIARALVLGRRFAIALRNVDAIDESMLRDFYAEIMDRALTLARPHLSYDLPCVTHAVADVMSTLETVRTGAEWTVYLAERSLVLWNHRNRLHRLECQGPLGENYRVRLREVEIAYALVNLATETREALENCKKTLQDFWNLDEPVRQLSYVMEQVPDDRYIQEPLGREVSRRNRAYIHMFEYLISLMEARSLTKSDAAPDKPIIATPDIHIQVPGASSTFGSPPHAPADL